jgi:hypothetical protein
MNSTRIITAFPPPPGVTPNFVNPDFNGKQIIVAGIVLPLLMFPLLGARLYAKYALLKKIHYDDCTSSSQLTNKNIQLILIHRHDNPGCGRLLLPLMPSHSELTKFVSLQPFTLVFSIMQMLRESPVFLTATNFAKTFRKPEMGLGTIFGIFRYLSSKPISSCVYSPLFQSSVCRDHI